MTFKGSRWGKTWGFYGMAGPPPNPTKTHVFFGLICCRFLSPKGERFMPVNFTMSVRDFLEGGGLKQMYGHDS